MIYTQGLPEENNKEFRIAVVLFAYNRIKYLKKAIKTHYYDEELDYFCYIDYSLKQEQIFNIVNQSAKYDWIIRRYKNRGLNGNIINGINNILNFLGYDAVIVLEDDLLLADGAIDWLKKRLETFRHFRGTTAFISLCKGDTLEREFKCWGWATWKEEWNKIDWNVIPERKDRDSWDVIIDAYMKKAGLTCYCSEEAKVKHIGAKGVHYNLFGFIKEKFK